jgi:hypothetical protein
MRVLCDIKLAMRTRIVATLELVLIFPAALFMAALLLRNLGPLPYESAHRAQQLVMWYAARMWTLWVLLLGLPLIVLVSSCAELVRNWNRDVALQLTSRPLAIVRAHFIPLVIAATTLIAGVILAVVVLHVLAN